ncbi:signal peptidase I [Amycolatopsis lexingtonensis]|uniref:Signal peptidase I n=1 Tax=Amycolatopsis lexingtonensis TaxID=218822 RepID=A0ABR9I0H7_9PSEU|nr:signal peptidase I [Amycolatopsis lexingtonensis]MBE1496699.1 signal peptidase I [Amycolatopsis lexingtonensis]
MLLLGFGVTGYGLGTDFGDYRAYRVPGVAMSPTVKPGDSAVVRVRHGEEVYRGDLVLFDRGAFAHPDSAGPSALRVVAVAGDVVACCTGGRLSVDGEPITETYLSQDEYAHDPAATTPYLTRMHEGTVFVLGDERGRARDSRLLGVVPLSAVTGFVVGTGSVLHPAPLAPTTAFTDAGLPGTPYADETLTGLRWWILGGAALSAAGLSGLIVAAVRSAGRRRRAAAGPPVR